MNELISKLFMNILNTNVSIYTNENESSLSFIIEGISSNLNENSILYKDKLKGIILSLEDNYYYEIVDNFRIRIFTFKIDNEIIIIGPYIRKPYYDEDIIKVLSQNKLSNKYLSQLKTFYSNFTITDPLEIEHTANALIKSFYNENKRFIYKRINDLSEVYSSSLVTNNLLSFEEITRKYDIENSFLEKIREGRVNEIEKSFSFLTMIPDLKYTNVYLTENYKIYLASLRALVRKSAEQSGLSVIVIDGILQKYTQLMNNERNFNNATKYAKNFTIEITEAVRNHLNNKNNYSHFVNRVISILEVNYTEETKLDILAKYLKTSISNLEHSFKKETSKTIKEYITELRLSKAHNLLLSSNLSIIEISDIVGYYDQTYFTKLFKKYYHITPRQLRISKN